MSRLFHAATGVVGDAIGSFTKVNAAEKQKWFVCSHIYKFIREVLTNISKLSELDKKCVLENLELSETFPFPVENSRDYCDNYNALSKTFLLIKIKYDKAKTNDEWECNTPISEIINEATMDEAYNEMEKYNKMPTRNLNEQYSKTIEDSFKRAMVLDRIYSNISKHKDRELLLEYFGLKDFTPYTDNELVTIKQIGFKDSNQAVYLLELCGYIKAKYYAATMDETTGRLYIQTTGVANKGVLTSLGMKQKEYNKIYLNEVITDDTIKTIADELIGRKSEESMGGRKRKTRRRRGGPRRSIKRKRKGRK